MNFIKIISLKIKSQLTVLFNKATLYYHRPHICFVGFARNYSTPELGFRNDSQPQFAANTTFGSRDELGLMNDNFNDPSQIKQQPTSTGATVTLRTRTIIDK